MFFSVNKKLISENGFILYFKYNLSMKIVAP